MIWLTLFVFAYTILAAAAISFAATHGAARRHLLAFYIFYLSTVIFIIWVTVI